MLLSECLYELDPSGSGVAELISLNKGLYQNASVFKSGQLTAQSGMVGAFYDLPLNNSGKMFLKSRVLIGMMGCTVPEIEVMAQHQPGKADKNGNSIDTVETWDSPKIYAYFITYRLGTGLYYALNNRFSAFVNVDYQGCTLSFANVPVIYNLSVKSDNANNGTSNTISNSVYTKEVNPAIKYQSIIVGLGCEIRF